MKKRINLIFMTAIIFMSSLVPANAMAVGTEGDLPLDEHQAFC